MRHYLLDTTPLTAYLFGRPAAVARIDPWLAADEVATSVLAYAEVVEYLRGQPDFAAHYRALRELLTGIYPYALTYPILDRYSVLRRQLRPPHGPGLIGDIDTLIAATALQAGVIALLFGGGGAGVTCACDTSGQGMSADPAPIDGNTEVSLNADDDGGYFREQAAAFYREPLPQLLR